MILKDKVRYWASEGVPMMSGGFDNKVGLQFEEVVIKQLTKETLEDGSFVEAVMFRLYSEAWIEVEDWDGVEKQVVALLEEETELLGIT